MKKSKKFVCIAIAAAVVIIGSAAAFIAPKIIKSGNTDSIETENPSVAEDFYKNNSEIVNICEWDN